MPTLTMNSGTKAHTRDRSVASIFGLDRITAKSMIAASEETTVTVTGSSSRSSTWRAMSSATRPTTASAPTP